MGFKLADTIYMEPALDLAYERTKLLDELDQVESLLESEGWSAADGGHLAASEGEGPATAGGATNERPGGAIVESPPAVIRGTNPQAVVTVGVDWLRMTGPVHVIPMVRQVLEAVFGDGEAGKGLFLYTSSIRFHGGLVRLLYDAEGVDRHAGKFTVEIPGGALASLTADQRIELLRDLAGWHMKATRLDVAIDLVGFENDIYLVEGVLGACERGELIGARRWRPIIERTAKGRLTGATVYLGKRGSEGSGRMVRCYDKGLESGLGVANRWHRWEVEFSGDCASQVADHLAGVVEWIEPAIAVALGAVDFKMATGARDSYRRPRAAWWADLVKYVQDKCALEPECVKAKRKPATLPGFVRWFNRNVVPTLREMGRIADWSYADVLAWLMEGEPPKASGESRPVLVEFAREIVKRSDWRVVA